MRVELYLLVWSVALTLAQCLIAVVGAMQQVGLPTLVGNREGLPAITGWAGRAERAHRNMLQSLVLFTGLVLVAQATGKFDATTALGAQLFFWARLAYAAVYIIGLPWIRTGVWAISVLGLVLIFIRLV